jgi:murein DD-endopeptidase
VFARRHTGLIDFTAAVLCLWAAYYHTPLGAASRSLIARMTGHSTAARPLLAYYSGGVYEVHELETPTEHFNVPNPELFAAVAEGPAVGRGVVATYRRLAPGDRQNPEALARRYGADPAPLGDPSAGPELAATLVGKANAELGSEDAAVLALFSGFDTAHFAASRARAEGRPLTLEYLAQQLPPSKQAEVDSTSQALMLGTAWSLAWPVPASTRITSGFGWRDHPILGKPQFHGGVDLGVPEGTPVHATQGGVVRRASEDALNGRIVIIDHGHGVWTAYCHNSKLLVSVGQQVQAGEVIAESGNTGRSTGPHVHYQLELAHKPIDPLAFKGRAPVALAMPPGPAGAPTPTRPGASAPKMSGALKAAFEHAGQLDGGVEAVGGTEM